jgi:hypothetical protein
MVTSFYILSVQRGHWSELLTSSVAHVYIEPYRTLPKYDLQDESADRTNYQNRMLALRAP